MPINVCIAGAAGRMGQRLIALSIALLFYPLTNLALAQCNLKVAKAAGQYLAELEKAGLTKYQNNSVCEALDYEFWSCSKSQKATLDKSFKVIRFAATTVLK